MLISTPMMARKTTFDLAWRTAPWCTVSALHMSPVLTAARPVITRNLSEKTDLGSTSYGRLRVHLHWNFSMTRRRKIGMTSWRHRQSVRKGLEITSNGRFCCGLTPVKVRSAGIQPDQPQVTNA